MLPTYQNTISNKDVLSFEQCEMIYSEIIKGLNINDLDEIEYWQDFVLSCIEYTEIRSKWLLLNTSQKNEIDNKRTIIHDGLIIKLKIIKRLLNSKNIDTAWFEDFKINSELGDETSNLNRKQIGDLANYIVYLYAVNGR